MKTSVKVDIPDSLLGPAKEEEIKKLKKEVSKLNNRISKLEIENKKLKSEASEVKRYRDAYENLRLMLADSFDLYVDRYGDLY